MHRSISAGVETTPSSSIARASSANAFNARERTCSAVDGVVPFSTKAIAAGLAPTDPSSFLM